MASPVLPARASYSRARGRCPRISQSHQSKLRRPTVTSCVSCPKLSCTCSISGIRSSFASRCTAHVSLQPHNPHRRRSAVRASASFVEIADASLSGPAVAAGVAVLAAAALAGWRFYLYSQLEFIIASMLTRYTPKVKEPGARVLQFGGGTKELFYYPKGTGLVTVVDEGANPGLFDQAGVQAGVGCVVKAQSPVQLQFTAGASVDAVVSIRSLSKLPPTDLLAALEEIHRVLKPGSPFVFIEPVEDQAAVLRAVVGSASQYIASSFFDELKTSPKFDTVSWDVALQGQDPHAVGIAVKATPSEPQQSINGSNRSKRKSRSSTGFT